MFSNRITSITPSGIREIFENVGGGAINLGLGEPDFQPPLRAREALKKALDQGLNKYGPTNGLIQLKESVAFYLRKYNQNVTPEDLIITTGATEALMITTQSLFQEGQEVLVPEPGFVLYRPHIVLTGAEPVPYPLDKARGFDPDVEQIKEQINERTTGIIVNSPSNPTGGVISEETHRSLVDVSLDEDLWLISDEVYDNFVYEGKHYSFCENLEKSVVVNSFSKSMATTGWRLGYMTSNREVIDQVSKMHYYTVACPPTPIQYAINSTLCYIDDFLEKVIPAFDRRRKKMVSLINEIPGFECSMPRGAFYAFPSYDFDVKSMDLAKRIAREGVICSPGSAFGEQGEGHIRFSYAASEEDIEKGLRIVKDVVQEIS